MTRKIQISWPDFKTVISAELLEKENPVLCDEFWKGLPFETLFTASMSAGKMFKVPAPITFSAMSAAKLAFFPDQPIGTIFALSSTAGLLVKYGLCVEPFRIPRIAMISSKDLARFLPVVSELRDAYFHTKVINKAVFSRAGS
jgi:hypothetical protein